MLEKTARKTSNDPAQEKLRQDKANWNKEVSAFINDLIHLKKMMNGWPSKFYKERSRITQPIPADPNTILGSLAGDFQQLAQRGEAIVQEQLSYAKNRRQKQPKPAPQAQAPQAPATPQQPPANENAQPDLSKQLAAWEHKYNEELVTEGSNKLTRTLTRTLNFPGSLGWSGKAKKRRQRMNMLKRASKVYKLVGKFQVKIVAPLSGKDSIKESYELLRTVKNEWELVGESLDLFREAAGPELSTKETEEELKKLKEEGKKPKDSVEVPPEEKQPEEQPPAAEQAPPAPQGPTDDIEAVALARNVKNDYTSILRGRIGGEAANVLSGVVNQFVKEPALTKADVARLVLQQYTALLADLRSKYGVAGNSLKEIETAIQTKEQAALPPGVTMPKKASNQIEVVAQDFLKKYVGKARHTVLPGDTSDYRVRLFDLAKELREEINKFMDLAESRKTLVPQFEEQDKKVKALVDKMSSHMLKLYRLYFRVPKEMQGLV